MLLLLFTGIIIIIKAGEAKQMRHKHSKKSIHANAERIQCHIWNVEFNVQRFSVAFGESLRSCI